MEKLSEKNEIKISQKNGFDHFEKPKKKKVCILGTAPSCKDAPYEDPSFDFWGVAHCIFLEQVKKLDVIFELHQKDVWLKDNSFTGPAGKRFPDANIYLIEKDEMIPNSLTFPIEEIRKRFKVNKGYECEADYFSSSLPYMLCLAIAKGYEEIKVYGIHLLMDEEYFYQRPCFEYYCGIAVGKGIKLYIHPAADILKFPYLYGYQDMTDEARKIRDRIDEFNKRLNAITNQQQSMMVQMEAQKNQLIGAKEDALYFLRTLGVEGVKKTVIF